MRRGWDLARAGRAVAARLWPAPDAAGPGALLLPCYPAVQPTAPSSSKRGAMCLGGNCLPCLRPVNRRQGSAGVPGRPGSVRGGRLLEGAGRRDACSGVSERGRGLLAGRPGRLAASRLNQQAHPPNERPGPLCPPLCGIGGAPALSAFHVPEQVTTTMRELSRGTHGRSASTALSALAAWR